jgi:transcriptional regulator with XRE-family HTH domain/tetratricopeptide (TPR) repeat protein
MPGGAGDGFGMLLRRHRLAAGLTQEGLAERSGVSARAVSDLERGGGRVPRLETVGLLAGALGLTPEQRGVLLAAARPGAGSPDAASWIGAMPHPVVLESPQLFGREREQQRLRASLAAAIAGQGRLVLIGGQAGIGKTALAEALAGDAAQAGALVLTGRCYDLTETPPYGPWIELFAQYQRQDWLPSLPTAFAERGTVGAVASQMALFQHVVDFLSMLTSHGPLVLVLDDVHWADPASLDLVRFLAHHLAPRALLLVVAYRTEEVTRHHPLYQLLPLLAQEAPADRLDLPRLPAVAVLAHLAERYALREGDTARLAAYLEARAGGNALFTIQLLRSLEEEGVLNATGGHWMLGDLAGVPVPTVLRQVIDARLARVGEEAETLLRVGAVIGQEVPLDIWHAVVQSDEDTLLARLAGAVAGHLIEATADGAHVRFAHALIREALYEGMSPPTRRRVHRRVGEVLAESPAPDPDAVASHFQRAGDARALPWLLAAGRRAQAAFAWTTAAARFEVALDLIGQAEGDVGARAWLLIRLSGLLRFVDVARARAFAHESYVQARAAGDEALAAYARFQRGLLACHAGDLAEGMPELEAGAAALALLSNADLAHVAEQFAAIDAASLLPDGHGTLVLWRAFVGRHGDARELGERLHAEDEADSGGLGGINSAYFGLGNTYAMLGMPGEALAMYARAHAAHLREGHYLLASIMSSRALGAVALPYRTEDVAGRRRLARRADAETARASGAVPSTIPARYMSLPLLVVEGEWDEAERLAVMGSAEERGDIGFRAYALRYLATVAQMRGDVERAWWAVRELLPAGAATEPGTVPFFDWVVSTQEVAATLALDDGDLATARQWLDSHDRWLTWSGAVLGRAHGYALRARYHRAGGNSRLARRQAERALGHAMDPRQPLALLAVHRLLGELDTDGGRYDDAARHLGTSLALADACQAPYERALTLLATAKARAATGDADAARTLLVAAGTIGASLGATPVLAQAHHLANGRASTGPTEAPAAAALAGRPSHPRDSPDSAPACEQGRGFTTDSG